MSWKLIFTAVLLGRLVMVVGTSGRTGRAVRFRWLAGCWIVDMSGRHSGDKSRRPGCHLDAQDRVPRDVLLARTATGPLTRYDRATLEDLAAPHAPRLAPLDGAGQALHPERALRAEGLGQFQLGRGLGEPQVRVEGAARQVGLGTARDGT